MEVISPIFYIKVWDSLCKTFSTGESGRFEVSSWLTEFINDSKYFSSSLSLSQVMVANYFKRVHSK